MKILGLIAAAALLAGAQSAYAVTINNGSFESGPAVTSNGYQQVPDGVGVPANAISGWTVGGAGVDYHRRNDPVLDSVQRFREHRPQRQ